MAVQLARVDLPEQPGNGLLRADLLVTVVLAVVLVVAVVDPDTGGPVAAGWALAVFFVGCGLFLWAFAIAVQRSRSDAIGIGGLFFLADSAPDVVRRRFLVLLAAQTVLSVAAASARPFTSVAFGVLAPMFGLGVQGLWAARHGEFPAR